MNADKAYTVFADTTRVTTGDRDHVTAAVKALLASRDERTVLVFDNATGVQVDLDLRAAAPTTAASTTEDADSDKARPRGPGRPRLGVVGKEVTLLPRHWDWLKAQPGGASVALRKLVEQARRDNAGKERIARSQGATHGFISAIAGNEVGYEEAMRALYARDTASFEALIQKWPTDVREYASKLAAPALGNEQPQASDIVEATDSTGS